MIYICTHKLDDILYTPQDEYSIISNEPSLLNNDYRHLRGMYKIYQMSDLPDEIGIYQYRRYMDISSIPKDYDMVIPIDILTGYNYTMKGQFIGCHPLLKRDFEIIENILGEDFIKYINLIHTVENPCYFWHNIFIMKRVDFLHYCDFLFTVLHKYETVKNIYNLTNESICFLAERVGSYWIYNYQGNKYLKEVITL